MRPFELHVPLTPRTYDIDFAQIVSNIVYIRWLEDMRIAFLDKYMPLQPMVARGVGPALIATNIEYKRPIRMFDEVTGKMWLEDIGNTRWTIGAEFVVKGGITTSAIQHGVLVEFATMRPQPVPDNLRADFIAQKALWAQAQVVEPPTAQ